jgi:NAD(P)-dependent dehydrogenase (short-subunit alcohol dehydrogenase family)
MKDMAELPAEKQVWLVTGAGRGMGVDITRAALAAGHAVVATGRDPRKVASAVGEAEQLLAARLDVTDPASAAAAVQAAIDRFGRIDVLVNNAGNFNAGFFEELSPAEFRAQIETTLFGPVNVTRAALPHMRAQRSGLVVTISSTAGIEGGQFLTAYAASKFGVEGWMESLTPEVAPFGIRTMLVEPGFFRTELLTPESTNYAESTIEDYAERTAQTVAAWQSMNGKQGGDPAKLADALVHLAGQDEPPLRFPPAPTRSRPSRAGPSCSSPRPTRTASCPATSTATTLNRRADDEERGIHAQAGPHADRRRLPADRAWRGPERSSADRASGGGSGS